MTFANLLKEGAIKEDIAIIQMGSCEAEAVKLFSNSYLAMRVSFFNELDSYALHNGLNARQIIEGTSQDPRIGKFYNNPSFGYGGYCLPKDTKQLLANFKSVPQNIIQAIVDSNETRINYLTDKILDENPKIIGIYRLVMKEGSDNWRQSAVLGVMNRLKTHPVELIIYEPAMEASEFAGCQVIRDLEVFKTTCDLILANRMHPDLNDISDKIFSRDLFTTD